MAPKKETRGKGKSIQKLKLKKETLKDLGVKKDTDVKGGMRPETVPHSTACPSFAGPYC